MRVDDWVPKTVVFIGRESREQFLPEGTGFITAKLVSADQGWQTIVTAKHVIQPFPDEDRICARLNGRDGKARLLQLPEAGWYFHEDPAIDVTVFPITIGKDVFEFAHFPIADFLPPDSPVAPKNVAVNP